MVPVCSPAQTTGFQFPGSQLIRDLWLQRDEGAGPWEQHRNSEFLWLGTLPRRRCSLREHILQDAFEEDGKLISNVIILQGKPIDSCICHQNGMETISVNIPFLDLAGYLPGRNEDNAQGSSDEEDSDSSGSNSDVSSEDDTSDVSDLDKFEEAYADFGALTAGVDPRTLERDCSGHVATAYPLLVGEAMAPLPHLSRCKQSHCS